MIRTDFVPRSMRLRTHCNRSSSSPVSCNGRQSPRRSVTVADPYLRHASSACPPTLPSAGGDEENSQKLRSPWPLQQLRSGILARKGWPAASSPVVVFRQYCAVPLSRNVPPKTTD